MRENFNVLQGPLAVGVGARLPKILLTIVALFHTVLLLFLSLNTPADFYNSPDEAANASFTRGIKENGQITLPSSSADLPSSVVPRGIHRTEQGLVPVGMVSVPLILGSLAKVVGTKGVPFVIALLGGLGIIAWYHFLRPLFGSRLALVSGQILALHPFVLYWGARPFMPNALFLALLLIALFFLGRVLWPTSSARGSTENRIIFEKSFAIEPVLRRRASSCMFGLCLGLAIAVRPQEGVWISLIPLALLLRGSLRRLISWSLFIPAFLLPIGSLLLAQATLYGAPLQTGYHLTPPSASPLHFIQALLFPFGFDGARIGSVAYYYLFEIIWPFAILAFLGIVSFLFKKNGVVGARLRQAAFVTLMLTLWLLFYYGSFEFYDRFDHGFVSMGSSFSRYFLPLYVLSSIFIASALLAIRKYAGRLIGAIVVCAMTVFSLAIVFWGSDESFARIAVVARENQEIKANVLSATPPEAIILTDRSDKIFYPSRSVVTVFRSAKFSQSRFEELFPYLLYYDTIASPEVVAVENEKFWGPHGLKAIEPVDLGYRHTLYKLEILNSAPKAHPPREEKSEF